MTSVGGQFVRFLVAGGVNTAATFALYAVLLRFVPYLVAYSVSYAVGILLSYALAVGFVFRKRASLVSFLRYPLVYVLQYLVGAGVLWTCVEGLGWRAEWGMVASVIVSVPVTFLAGRLAVGD